MDYIYNLITFELKTMDNNSKYEISLRSYQHLGKFTWFERFAIDRGYDSNLMAIWAAENENFSGAYKMAKDLQKTLYLYYDVVGGQGH